MAYNLSNKLALITGAASGLGLASAQLFARNSADLALVDSSPRLNQVVEELKALHPERQITGHVYDLTLNSNVSKIFGEIQSSHVKYACPTVLVNSAGISGIPKPIVQCTENEYDQIINVNLKGTYLITQELLKLLIANYSKVKFNSPTESYASIINFSSSARYGAPFAAEYSISKAGVEALAKSVAKEYGAQRIRCNAILPYFIETPLVHAIMSKEIREFYENRNALKRFGHPDEVAQLIYFLATDASSYISGASIDINGGLL